MRHTDFIECPYTNLFYRIQLGCCVSRMQRGICTCNRAMEALDGIGVKLAKPKKAKRRVTFDDKPKKTKKRRAL